MQVQGQLAACLLLRGTMRFDHLAGVDVVASLVRSMGQVNARCAFLVENIPSGSVLLLSMLERRSMSGKVYTMTPLCPQGAVKVVCAALAWR